METMNICVIGGAGYVGLITGLCLSEIGHNVVCMDVDGDRIRMLQSGVCPIYEDGIEPLLKGNLQEGRVQFSTDLPSAVTSSEVIFVTVGTPSGTDGGSDSTQVIRVAEELADSIDSYKALAIKSTVPVGTLEQVRQTLSRRKQEGKDFDIVANPEFLREGKGIHDFFYPDRIVIGTSSERATQALKKVYEPIISGLVAWTGNASRPSDGTPVPVIETSISSAQMIKYVSNAFLATRISFINEMASLCETVNADVSEVVRGAGYDPRIGHDYMVPGLGFGGPCLEKDLRALIEFSENNGHQPHLLKSVLEGNDAQVGEVISKLRQLIGNPLNGKTVAVFGLTFKAGTNDLRNSPALKAIDLLAKEGVAVRAYDPVVMPESRSSDPLTSYFNDPYETANQANALMILTDWPDFRELDYARIKSKMASPYIVDGRNLLDPESLRTLGFSYVGVGRT